MADDDTRIALRPDRQKLDGLQLSDVRARFALVPTNMAEVFEFSKMMSSGRIGVPAFLVGNPGDCLRIVGIAARSGLDPFMLADDAHEVNKRMAFGAKAIHAIVQSSGILEGDLAVRFAGTGEALTATVTGKRRGGQTHTETYQLATIKVRNSPLWATQPRQQMGYYAIRAWCRLHASDALMGLVAREDAAIDAIAVEVPAAPAMTIDKVAAQLSAPAQDPDTGELAPEAAAHMESIGETYAEVR